MWGRRGRDENKPPPQRFHETSRQIVPDARLLHLTLNNRVGGGGDYPGKEQEYFLT